MPAVLIIDDSQDLLHVYQTILTHAGWTVKTALGSRAGVEAARHSPPDVMVMGMAADNQDRERFLAATAGDARLARIPLLILAEPGTFCPSPPPGRRWLTRPVAPRELVHAVGEMLPERQDGSRSNGSNH